LSADGSSSPALGLTIRNPRTGAEATHADYTSRARPNGGRKWVRRPIDSSVNRPIIDAYE
jgi:hypothetical protein